MAKWKCPEDAGPGVSIGGEWFPAVDGIIETPEGEAYALALGPHGYKHIPPTAEEMAAAAQAAADEAKALAEEAAAAAAAAQEEADRIAAEAEAQGELKLDADETKADEGAAADEAKADEAKADEAAADTGKKSKK